MRIVFGFLLLLFLVSCSGRTGTDVHETAVLRGTFLGELTEEGTVEAVNSVTISAPVVSYRYGSIKIARIVEDGEEVEKGDTVIVFDPSEIKRAIVQAEQQLAIARAEYEKLLSTQQSEIEDLQSDLELARISHEISRINFETSVYEPEATKKEIKLKLGSAEIALERAREQIENKKIIHKEDLVQKSLSIKQLTKTLEEANQSMSNLFVVSPARGIAIKEENWNTGQKWAVGDQPYPGSSLIELPDFAAMRAELKIGEVDISKVLPGQKVEIRPDAYSDSIYTGTVESVANLAQNKDYKSKIKIFPVQVRIKGQSRKLLPGLTVSCRIIVNEVPDVLYIPVEALFEEQGSEYVFLKSGSRFKRQDVKAGAMNNDYIIVNEGQNEISAKLCPLLVSMMKVKNRKGSPGSLLKFIFLFFGIAMSLSCMRDGESGYRIMKGQFRQSVIESGELQAVNASFLTMPRISYVYGYRFKVVGLAEHGKTVKKGEEVVRVDPASIQKYIIERQESLENEIAASNKLRAQVTNNLQELRAQLRSEQASYDLKKLQYEKSGFEADAIKKVIELEFRQSEIRLTKTKRALAVRPGLDSLDIRIQQIKVEQKRDELEAAEETLARLVVRSPLDGVFVVEKNWSTGQTIKVGDEVFLGMPVARIPDINRSKGKEALLWQESQE